MISLSKNRYRNDEQYHTPMPTSKKDLTQARSVPLSHSPGAGVQFGVSDELVDDFGEDESDGDGA
ncbi:hypothetical protein KH172YL63_04050 [Bacillus sp. KH172YL63]|nr:hypothetical protein KH172YL63_04050 [Bacillus sp. KH172YL63]